MYAVDNLYEAGKVIVALHKKCTSDSPPDSAVRLILDGVEYEKAELIFRADRAGDENETGDILLVYLKDKSKEAVTGAVKKLSDNPYVVFAEPDYTEQLHLIPNDPLYRELWGTQRVGAPLAWNYTIGSPDVSVGVIDSGIDYGHPDICKNMWVSKNGRLHNGWDFAGNHCNPTDTNGHGTHVAGTVGAVGNNCLGITGVCLKVKVASLKFGLDVASAVAAIYFANRYDIPILNASWGGRAYSRALQAAIENYSGLFVASAGNFGENNDTDPLFPASYGCANIISVAATDPEDSLAGFSNYGVKSVDIAAPGTGILSLDLYGGYSPMNGTSMSAPHVAGAAALLKAYNPGISVPEMKNIILSTAAQCPGLTGKILTGGILSINAMFQMALQRI